MFLVKEHNKKNRAMTVFARPVVFSLKRHRAGSDVKKSGCGIIVLPTTQGKVNLF